MRDENYSQYQYQSIRYTWAKQKNNPEDEFDNQVERDIIEQEKHGFPEVTNILDYIKGL